MVRKITGAIALALMVGASVAHAAGLGKLTVNSSLGQILNAEIDLVSVQPGELDVLQAKVASPEAYRDARIEYSSSLRLLRFSVDKRPNGQPYLKVTSVAPINEPFVDMLIEVTWPAGRIQREYPILLDPPGYAQKVAPPSVAAAPASRAPEAAPPASAPAASSATPATAPSAAPAASADTGAGPSARAELASAPPGAPRESSAGGDSYGPVQRGDTLRKIAEETKPSDVSLEQMLVALYRENKGAFVGNNMNRLKTGQILKVPSAEEVSKVTRGAAGREIRTHVADWKAYREQLASGVAAAPTRTAESGAAASGRIGSAAVAPPAPPASEPKDVLKITKTEGGKAGPGGAGNAQARINALQEELTAKDKALREAQSRVQDLEGQIRDMQRLAELKSGKADPKVAGVTPPPGMAATKPGEPPKAAAPTKAPEPAKPAEPTKVEPAKPADTKLAEAPKAPDAAKAPEAAKPAAPVDATKADATKLAEAPKADAPKADAPKPEAAKPAAPKKAPPPPPARSWTDDLMEPWVLAAGAGGLLALGLVGFMVARRRRQEAEGPMGTEPSAFPSDLKSTTGTGKPAAGLVDTGNSSFLTDFDKTGPGTIDTDEVDPVAEAEVYIAYGRDAQAEEILKEAMARDRGRHEIALKLLEIYHARKSATAFETVAKELRSNVGESHPMWQKAAAMGAQIDPNNPLYGAAAAGGAAAFTAATSPAPAAAKPDLDFDLETSSSAKSAPEPDFDLDLDRKPAGAMDLATDNSPAIDFDIDSASTPQRSTSVDVPAEPAKEEKPAFDFDLSGLDFPGTKSSGGPDLDLGKGDGGKSSMDLADLSLDSPADAGGGGGEAVGTKLELAKAYLEIGDKDGAREILQEVAKEGSSAQKQEAQKLIASL